MLIQILKLLVYMMCTDFVDGITGEIMDTYTSLNHQRKYGIDVLSRILAANSGMTEELKRLIESLKKQTYSDFEVVIVSQGNHDMVEKCFEDVDFYYKQASSTRRYTGSI